jgi:hypothetical protein
MEAPVVSELEISWHFLPVHFQVYSKLVTAIDEMRNTIRIFGAATGVMLHRSRGLIHSSLADSKQLCGILDDKNGILVTHFSPTSVDQGILAVADRM